MSKEREYQELYDRLRDEVSTLHENNRRRIRIGMRMLLAVTLGLMLLMFLAEGNKVFTLMLWILSMFAVAALLIGLLVRKPFMGLNRFMEEKLEETELLKRRC